MVDVTQEMHRWLFGAALPLWMDSGYDPINGGFYDKIDQAGRPLPGGKRLRVQARQVFVYCEAGRLGWEGPWRQAVEGGLAFLRTHYKRPDGLYRRMVSVDGAIEDDRADLYDQAFVLFALAATYRSLSRESGLMAEAQALVGILDQRAENENGGYRELDFDNRWLRSNPHMHLLEAILAWIETAPGHGFEERARKIVNLATMRFVDHEAGAIGEYFTDDWEFAPGSLGELREPGHQFEWSFLLRYGGDLLGESHRHLADRLYAFASKSGIISGRAIASLDSKGRPVDRSCRLWSQTERLRAATLRIRDANLSVAREGSQAASESISAIQRHLDTPISGLWFDRITENGEPVFEPAPASSLYHLITGLMPLLEPPIGEGTEAIRP